MKGLTDLVMYCVFGWVANLFRLKEVAHLAVNIKEEVAETESAIFLKLLLFPSKMVLCSGVVSKIFSSLMILSLII